MKCLHIWLLWIIYPKNCQGFFLRVEYVALIYAEWNNFSLTQIISFVDAIYESYTH